MTYRDHLTTDIGEYELPRIGKYIDPSRLAVDIGGHEGVYSCHFLKRAKGVVVFEANPAAAKEIGERLPGLRVENIALSSEEGTAILRIPRGSAIHSLTGCATIEPHNDLANVEADKVEVPMRTLDSYALDNVGFVKIDVEGHEESVLKGGRNLIATSRPVLMLEIEERHNKGALARISAALAELGYQGFFFKPETGTAEWPLRPLAEFDVRIHQTDELIHQLSTTPRRRVPYVNNFIFLPQ